jgi:outer membrane protein assembly factor BamD (BamD/ComL family)
MDTRLKATTVLLAAALVYASVCDAQTASSTSEWAAKMTEGQRLFQRHRFDEAFREFEGALTASPSEDHKGDALIFMAQCREATWKRWDAIDIYKRIVSEHSSCLQVAQANFRLGELHRSISLIALDAKEEDEKRQLAETTDENAKAFFEAAVKAGDPYNRYVLSSKAYLSGIYEREEALTLLHELANLDIYAVKTPFYSGPWEEANSGTMSVWVDKRRGEIWSLRSVSRGRLVARSVSVLPGDDVTSITSLQALAERYPQSDISHAAQAEIARITEKMAKKAAEKAAADAAGATQVPGR